MSPSIRRLGPLFGLLAAASIVVTACGAAAAPGAHRPEGDHDGGRPNRQAAKSVHVDVTLDGSIKADLTGTGAVRRGHLR